MIPPDVNRQSLRAYLAGPIMKHQEAPPPPRHTIADRVSHQMADRYFIPMWSHNK